MQVSCNKRPKSGDLAQRESARVGEAGMRQFVELPVVHLQHAERLQLQDIADEDLTRL